MTDAWDDLEREAEERLEELEQELPEAWGYLLQLAEGEKWRGYCVGTDEDTSSQFGPNRVYLLRDQDDAPCWLRGGRKILDAEWEKANPQPGDLVYIARGSDGAGQQGGVSHRFIVRAKAAPQGELPSSGQGDLPEDY